MSRDLPPKCRELPLMYRSLPLTCRDFPLMCRDSPARCRELPVMCRSFPLTCRDFPLRSLKQAYKKEVEFMFLDKSRIALLSSFLFPLLWERVRVRFWDERSIRIHFFPAPSPLERAGESCFNTKCYINKKNILQISMKFHCNM